VFPLGIGGTTVSESSDGIYLSTGPRRRAPKQ
jgi:hypothetical protein